ncbi:hypothetical protein GCM10010203_18770 [Actinomadura yumaensis]
MTRFASASPAARAALAAAAALLVLGLVSIGAMMVALIGLGRFSGDIDPGRVPA